MPDTPQSLSPAISPSVSRLAATLSLMLARQDRKSLRAAWLAESLQEPSRRESLLQKEVPGSGNHRIAGLFHPFGQRRIERHRSALVAQGVGALTTGEAGFPEMLAGIPDPPLLLYYRGALDCLAGTAIAIVGARRASGAGQAFSRSLAAELADAGVVIVSGLALGVDAAAHLGALEAGGRTIAVLGSGPDQLTPLANARLGERILSEGGLILSEYPPGTPAAPFRFPERNRLISGLSRGVVVGEANARSGSLITARLALEQGREVMAVPGIPGYLNSAGSNRLLKSGAALIERAEDVLHTIGVDGGPGRPVPELQAPSGLSPHQRVLLDLLDGRAQSLEVLAVTCGLREQDCAVTLTELELAGFVQRVGGGYIRRPFEF